MKLEDAIAVDCEGRIQEAASGYEGVLRQDPTNMTALINLVALYWQSTDFGFLTGKQLPSEYVSLAGRRLWELLDSSRARFPDGPEINFWAPYIAWADLDEPFETEECRTLLRENPGYLEPAMALFMWSQGKEAKPEALLLLRRCREAPTTRCQYVSSVIEATIYYSSLK